MSEPVIIVVGDIVTDILAVHKGPVAVGSDTDTRISITGGGSAANTATWLATLGHRVELVGVTGNDQAGTDRLAELAEARVGHDAVRRTGAQPTGSIIVLAQAEERSFLCDRGANALLETSDVDRAIAATDRLAHLHLSGYTLLHESSREAGRHALVRAHERGATTSVDAASAAPLRRIGGAAFLDWIRGTDILFANVDEARALLDDDGTDPAGLAVALTRYARQAALKMGGLGAIWASSDGTLATVPAAPAAAVVDPTGAGDAFAAGVLGTWLAGEELRHCLETGARLGALAVSRVGGRPHPAPPNPGARGVG